MKNKIRFGVIGCSRIAYRSIIPAIKKSELAELYIIGSRDMNKAKQFAEKFGCKNFGSYDDVIENTNVDAIYVSLPISLHEQWCMKAAKAGKHILCEKSATTSFQSACKIVETCMKYNVRILEGLMFRFHPQHNKVLEIVQNGTLGKLVTFTGMYGFPPVSKDDIRYQKDLGGGVLNETGCYPICASRIIFNDTPLGVFCKLKIDDELGVDTSGNMLVLYKDRAAHISFSFESHYQGNYRIIGSDGVLDLNRAYAIPPDLNTTISVDAVTMKKSINIKAADHFLLMIDSFSKELSKIEQAGYNFEKDLLLQASILECSRISNSEGRFVPLNELIGIESDATKPN